MLPFFPRSSESSFAMSSSDNAKSYTAAFEIIRLGVEDFGSGTNLG
jgi:hypothetical protein